MKIASMRARLALSALGLFAVVSVSNVHQASAQVPRVFTYQGQMTNGNTPVDGPHTVKVSLYDASSPNTPFYTETQIITVVGGIFSIDVGLVNAFPASVKFDKPYYIGLAIDNGAELQPRARVNSAPYAIAAGTALSTEEATHAQTATTADVANSLSSTATGVVRTVNGQSGAVTLSGIGMTSISNVGGAITINTDVLNGSLTNHKINALGVPDGRVLSSLAGLAVWNPVSLTLPYVQSAGVTSNAFEITNIASGTPIAGISLAGTGIVCGITGSSASTATGTSAFNGVSGVLGTVTPATAGPLSAGLRGVNNSTTGSGSGVIGYQAGNGSGVYGETPNGAGVYGSATNTTAGNAGVRGETFSPNGSAVEAKYSGTGVGVALKLDNGTIKVSGTNKAAFIHTATSGNKLSTNGTDIDNALCNGDPNAILFVTQRIPNDATYNKAPIGTIYNTTRNRWEIVNVNLAAITTGAQFNVLVIKQ